MTISQNQKKLFKIEVFTALLLILFLPRLSLGTDQLPIGGEERITRCEPGEFSCNYSGIPDLLSKACSSSISTETPTVFPAWFKKQVTKTARMHIDRLPLNFTLPPFAVADSQNISNLLCFDASGYPMKPVGMPISNSNLEKMQLGRSTSYSVGTSSNPRSPASLNFTNKTAFALATPITTVPGDYTYSYAAWEVHEAPHCTLDYRPSTGAPFARERITYGNSVQTFIEQTPVRANSCSSNSRTSLCQYAAGFNITPYEYKTCYDGCDVGSTQLRHNQGGTFYRTNSSYNCSSESTYRTCSNGSLLPAGTDSYVYPSCTTKVDCDGSWGACQGTCGTGTRTYSITTPATNGGNACPFADGATQSCALTACPTAGGNCTIIYHQTTPVGPFLDFDVSPGNTWTLPANNTVISLGSDLSVAGNQYTCPAALPPPPPPPPACVNTSEFSSQADCEAANPGRTCTSSSPAWKWEVYVCFGNMKFQAPNCGGYLPGNLDDSVRDRYGACTPAEAGNTRLAVDVMCDIGPGEFMSCYYSCSSVTAWKCQ